MKKIVGAWNEAVVYTDELEESAAVQLKALCNEPFTAGSRIRIMPDVHAGAGCTIGTTMTVTDKVVPNLVGVDIGCGMETMRLAGRHLELQKLDKKIQERIPAGFSIRQELHPLIMEIDLGRLRCREGAKLNLGRAERSLGTLGGGNHFIEVDQDEAGQLYLVIHSGSRHLGLEVANYYQRQAVRQRQESGETISQALAYLTGDLLDDYLHDMEIVQRFAFLNRKAIAQEIVRAMKLDIEESFTTIHNYIDLDQNILRKGAISAQKGEKMLIPLNMRDGSLICIGKGNPEWNCSAPHGAGRLMSRSAAKNNFTVSEFQKQMQGIYTTSADASTLDECPMAYKDPSVILESIEDTAEISKQIKPIYNFKAGEQGSQRRGKKTVVASSLYYNTERRMYHG